MKINNDNTYINMLKYIIGCIRKICVQMIMYSVVGKS